MGVLERRVDSAVDWGRYDRLEVLGLDEIALKKGHRSYVVIVTARLADERLVILGVLKDREKDTVVEFLRSIPVRLLQTIHTVCSDMYEGFTEAVREEVKSARLVIDRFHVAKKYREGVDYLRKQELRRLKSELPEEAYGQLKGSMWALRKDRQDLQPEDRQVLRTLFTHSPQLKAAYDFQWQLTDIFDQPISKSMAKSKIRAWINRVHKHGLTCFDEFLKTYTHWLEEITNFFVNREHSRPQVGHYRRLLSPSGRRKRWARKVSQTEAREDCRDTFEKWGLPDIFQTDLDKVLVCTDETPFPTDFKLCLVGLGIFHRLIRRVTQNASVERSHRTFDKQMLSGVTADTWPAFLVHVQSELARLTESIPSRANACHGQIPIQAHPEALTPKRPYRRDWEDHLFDMQRIYRYLFGGKWLRHTSSKGQFHFADRVYSVGTAYRSQYVILTFDLETKQFVVHAQAGEEVKRLSADWLTEARIRSVPEYEVVKEQPAM